MHIAHEESPDSFEDWFEKLPRDLDGWIELFHVPGSYIVDEYGQTIAPDEIIKIIKGRRFKSREKQMTDVEWRNYLNRNHATEGPNNLLRHKIGNLCVGHGQGTWDYLIGWFS